MSHTLKTVAIASEVATALASYATTAVSGEKEKCFGRWHGTQWCSIGSTTRSPHVSRLLVLPDLPGAEGKQL